MSEEFYSPLDASERILASGRPLAPREFVKLTKEEQKDPHNARLIKEGKLIKKVIVESRASEATLEDLQTQAKFLDIEGRSSMNKAELERAIDGALEAKAAEATRQHNAQEGNQ